MCVQGCRGVCVYVSSSSCQIIVRLLKALTAESSCMICCYIFILNQIHSDTGCLEKLAALLCGQTGHSHPLIYCSHYIIITHVVKLRVQHSCTILHTILLGTFEKSFCTDANLTWSRHIDLPYSKVFVKGRLFCQSFAVS